MNESDVEALKSALGGNLLEAGDVGYDAARHVWNGMIDRRPTLIARCRGTTDVVEAVRFAATHDLPISMRGGGHNVAGTAVGENALMLDLSGLRSVTLDPQASVARVQPGATLGDIDCETQVHGLATPTGVVSRTGIAGLCLNGGIGWLRRKHGLTCDNLIAAELVTANGEVVHASDATTPELMWGLRGGGGNFGVVTDFVFRLHPVGPEVFFTFVAYPANQREQCYRAYREWTRRAPEEASTLAAAINLPDDPQFPVPEARGQPALAFLGAWAGSPQDGERAMQPLREAGTPLLDFSGRMSWVEAQQLLDANFPDGQLYYWKGQTLTEEALSDPGIDRLIKHADARPSPLTSFVIWHMGGAVRRVDESDTAFGGRDAEFILAAESCWIDPAESETNIAWAREAVADMQAYAAGGLYLNYPGFFEDTEQTTKQAFGEKYKRLQALKDRYDPRNLFRFNANIMPSSVQSENIGTGVS